MLRRILRAAVLGGLTAVLIQGSARAQQRLIVRTEAGTPVIATQVLLAIASSDESPSEAGIAHVAARAVTRSILPALDSLGARLAINPQKDVVAITLTASPDTWENASRLLLVALFRGRVDSASVAGVTRAVEAELRGRRNSPADAAARAADAAFHGDGHPWGRPAVGTPETVARLSASRVSAFLRTHFVPERAFASVVGPIDENAARAHLTRFLPAAGPVPAALVARGRPARAPVALDYDAVTTWVSVAYPFTLTADLEALRMLAHLVADELSFGPTRRSVYDMRSEVTTRATGGEVRFTVVVPPEEAERWTARVQEIVDGMADQPRLVESWRALVRRYRGERLHQLSSPEQRAAEAVRNLFVIGEPRPLFPDFDALTASRVIDAAASLGNPALVLLGPIRPGL
jgi:predicted Zn-dependent peptidase